MNALIHETSPYLLQHAHNPVNWEPWSTEAFERAGRENKLVIVSIGYSACHWCHVMERESFEDEKVAKIMNENYICIKVDREERPDVDQLFMDAAQLMIGRGGWPLNAFALPDGRPVYAGTYFPKVAWTGLLHEVGAGYKKQPAKYLEYAEKLIQGIKTMSLIQMPKTENPFEMDDLDEAYFSIVSQVDKKFGGRGRAPKFPMPHNWLFMLRYYYSTKNEEALNVTLLTLDKMAMGGIYDQIGGGFARYATDQEWKIPHFEKMLYDNAQLLSLYAEAYLISGKKLYKDVVYDTVGFMTRELQAENGAFYCALDADSEGEEGKFYVWQAEEIDEIFGHQSKIVNDYFGIDGEALWEHGNNIPLMAMTIEELAAKHEISPDFCAEFLTDAKLKLLEARDKRPRPGLDNKILLSWNTLAIKGLLDCYKVHHDSLFLDLAKKTLQFLQNNMVVDGYLYHTYQNGTAKIPGFLEDYALYAEMLIAFYETTFDPELLTEAKRIMDYTIDHFYDTESGFFWFTSMENNELAARKIETSDNVIPAPNSVMAHNLFRIGILYDDSYYAKMADHMLRGMLPQIREQASFFSNWAILLNYKVNPFYEIALVGPNATENQKELEALYVPNKIMAGSITDDTKIPFLKDKYVSGKSYIYICKNNTCDKPVENVAEAKEGLIVNNKTIVTGLLGLIH